MSVSRVCGIVIALLGIVFIAGIPESVGQKAGLGMIVLGTLCCGVSQGIIRAGSRDAGPALMGGMSAIAAPQLLALSLIFESGQKSAVVGATISDWMSIAVLAIGGLVAAYSIRYSLLGRYRVDQVAPFALLMPPIGIAVSFAILGDVPTASSLLGGVIILFGPAVIVRARSPQ